MGDMTLGGTKGQVRKTLYAIVCAAPPASDVTRLIDAAQREGWDVCLLATPSAVKFIDSPELAKQTGHPVRSDYKQPDEPDALPAPDAIIVAPATVNSINKWAAGICDTLALGILVEAIGKRLPIVAMPFTNYAQAAHPAFEENIGKLRSWGVHVLYGPEIYPLHAPGTGSEHVHEFPWGKILGSLEQFINPGAELYNRAPN
jgi:phosphopantothenoylcysteine synthetase/decarboxylase